MDKVNWKDRYLRLKQYCINQGYKVEEVPDSHTKDFIGMNDRAAEELGLNKLPAKTLQIDNWITWQQKYHTLKHELVERRKMNSGLKYRDAHAIALNREVYRG